MPHSSEWCFLDGGDVIGGKGNGLPRNEADVRIGLGDTIITPALDTPLAGYYYRRMPVGVHDDLHAKTLLLANEDTQAVLVSCDLIRMPREVVEDSRQGLAARFGIPPGQVMISANHGHTGPVATPAYMKFLRRRIVESVESALGHQAEALLFVGRGSETGIARNRRYLMKDGTVITNPGFLNPNVAKPAGGIDPRLGVLQARTKEGLPLMTWVNFALHQDTVGGALISADFSYYLAQALARSLGPEMVTIFAAGAAADINHWDVTKPGPQRGLSTAETIGTRLATGVLRASELLEPLTPGRIRAASEFICLPLQKVTPFEAAEARKVLALPPSPNVDFTLDRVRAKKVLSLAEHNAPDVQAEIQVLSAGDAAWVGIPGEPFVELGLQMIERSPFANTFIVELANDNIGYIPTQRAFNEGGYEPASSILEPGAGEMIAEKAIGLLRRLKTES